MDRFLAVKALGYYKDDKGPLIDRVPCPDHITEEDAKLITKLINNAGLMLGLGVPVEYEVIITEDPELSLQECVRKSYPSKKDK